MATTATDSSTWKHRVAFLNTDTPIRIAYIDCPSPKSEKGVIVLLHGFPQTSYQFHHVITPFAMAGYRVIAPDYRGAGASSKPASGFTKSIMAKDILLLLDNLQITERVHVVGHDIGGMIAYALASRYPSRVASVVWGECPLPGTTVYTVNKTTHAVQQFHFIFHSVLDLPEALVAGRERIYLNHFFSKLAYNTAAISPADLDHYTESYSQPGAMRCAFEVYRAFETDTEENKQWLDQNGKSSVPAMALSGNKSAHKDEAYKMFEEVHKLGTFKVGVVPEAGHYIAEENPEGFIREVMMFIEENSSGPHRD